MERILLTLFQPYPVKDIIYGANQFAYTPEREARDAIGNLIIIWITTLVKRRKVGVYCSDVSGAFDRVRLGRLAAKLKATKKYTR